MSSAPTMPMFWDAYLADTTHLTTEEHGAYLLLLAAMWRRDGWVPDDDRDNARILGLTAAKWRRIKERLSDFLVFENGMISQKNLLKIWKNTQEKIQKNKENGAKGGRPKSNKNNNITKANGYVLDNPNKSIPEPEPLIATACSSSLEPAAPAAAHVELGFKILETMGVHPKDPTYLGNIGIVAQWLANGWDPDLDILPTVRAISERRKARGDGPPRALNFFTDAIGDAHRRRRSASSSEASAPVPLPVLDPDNQLTLKNGRVVSRRIAFSRLRSHFQRRLEGFPCSWLGSEWRDDGDPEAPTSVYPPEFVAEAKEAARQEFQPKSQATAG